MKNKLTITFYSICNFYNLRCLDLVASPVGRKTLSFSHKLSFFSYFINKPHSAAAQWMAIKFIPEVRW